MPALDWTQLKPHRPADLDGKGYVPRPEGGAAKLVRLVQAGASPIAIVGPMGSGKSTELGVAARTLPHTGTEFIVAWGLFDHFKADSLPLTTASAFAILSATLWQYAQTWDIELSEDLQRKLSSPGLLVSPKEDGGASRPASLDVFRETLREVRRASGNKPAVLCCDGLEKVPADQAREVLDALLQFSAETAIVVVIPTALVVGPSSYDVLSSFKLFPIGPVPVRDDEGDPGREGRAFLKSIVYRRLDLPPPGPPGLDEVLERAAEASGGVPRAFVQLVLDAATYARLAEREMPTMDDLRDAMGDHAESLRRLLNKGDVAALREADGTEGLEVEPERRLRFLTHGLLLEYKVGDRVVVHPAPLLAGILGRSGSP
jgi:energy-coupling factor transporter ATP-binding protein EcfA2